MRISKNERARRAQSQYLVATPVEKRQEVCDVCRGTGKVNVKIVMFQGLIKTL